MFTANPGAGLNAYRNVGVESLATSAAPHQLVLMLFDGARAAIAQAKGHLERRETAAKGEAISKAISIIDGGLKASLDLKVGGELATNLSDLYVYMGQRLLYANIKNDAKVLDEVATLLEQLGDAWRSIGAKPAAATAAGAAPGASPADASRAPVPGPAQTYGGAGASPSRAYGAAAAMAPAHPAPLAPAPTQGAAAAGQVQPGRAAAGASSAAPAGVAAGTSSPDQPASAAPAGPSPQSRRLAAAYGAF